VDRNEVVTVSDFFLFERPVRLSAALIISAFWAILVFEGLVIFALLRVLADARRLLEVVELPRERLLPGTAAPAFETESIVSSRGISLNTLAGRGGVLLFLSSTCGSCKRVLGGLQAPLRCSSHLIVLWVGEFDGALAQVSQSVEVAMVNARNIATAYHVTAFPTAVGITGDGLIAGYSHPSDASDLERVFSSAESNTSVRSPQRSHRGPATEAAGVGAAVM
jgi:hypothetical protein